jgi:predicted component of type VI protein secretion system
MGIYQLIIESGQRAGQCVQPPDKSYSIGRDAGNDLRLVEDGVSGRHCELRVMRAGVMVRDSRSTNGVYVNGQRVEEVRLHRGDVIELGGARLRFEFLVAAPGEYRRRTPLFWVSVLLVGVTFAVEFGAIGVAVWTRRHRITPEESAKILKFFPPIPSNALPDKLMPGTKPPPAANARPANTSMPISAAPAVSGSTAAPAASAAPVQIPGNR